MKLTIRLVRDWRIPMSGYLRVSHQPKEQNHDGSPTKSGSVRFLPNGRRPRTDSSSALSAGQTATHSRHPRHSAERIVRFMSTGKCDGQAFIQLAQSMQLSGFRRIQSGLAKAARPINAPYGHKYRHQKFRTNTDNKAKLPIATAAVTPIKRKKLSIFTSAIRP